MLGEGPVYAAMAHPWYRATIAVVSGLGLPDWAIGAGFVRNAVWDRLAGLSRTPLADVDVLYFDRADPGGRRERMLERRLTAALPRPWSVRNQARMHRRNGDRPYRSTADAMRFWLETPTTVAIRVDGAGRLRLIAPHGLHDLLAMRVRPTPAGRAKSLLYAKRVNAKNWQARWPGLVMEMPRCLDHDAMALRSDRLSAPTP
ncbi:MAG: nucleotidyltransferase family protein [Pseudomonadota bacterium]